MQNVTGSKGLMGVSDSRPYRKKKMERDAYFTRKTWQWTGAPKICQQCRVRVEGKKIKASFKNEGKKSESKWGKSFLWSWGLKAPCAKEGDGREFNLHTFHPGGRGESGTVRFRKSETVF